MKNGRMNERKNGRMNEIRADGIMKEGRIELNDQ